MKTMGIDYGTKHIGLALSDEGGALARPVGDISSGKSAIPAIKDLVMHEEVQTVVLGLPLPSEQQGDLLVREIQSFAEELKDSLPIAVSVTTFNEAYTTKRARQKIAEGFSSVSEHAAAAAEILQNFIDHRRTT